MSCDEAYNQAITELLNNALKNGFAKVELPDSSPKRKKIYGSRNAIKRLKKARKRSK